MGSKQPQGTTSPADDYYLGSIRLTATRFHTLLTSVWAELEKNVAARQVLVSSDLVLSFQLNSTHRQRQSGQL